MTAEPIIEIRDLSFAFGTTPVLEDVNLTIRRGDYVCMVGPNGGGKTTLLRLILGLLTPTRGTVRVFGTSPVEARRRIGYMPQHAQLDPQFPVRVRDVVLMGRLRNARLGPFGGDDRAKAAAALAEVGLADYAKRPFSALSGGQRQRVLIARALACEPELLLLDEPTANLDPLVQDEMNDLLRELNRRLTVILVSHDVGFVAQQVKTVVCVNRNVRVHGAEAITGDSIRALYGHDVQLVHHRHE
ncbi:MAG: ATP-binding cassette domain-containing protein [Planctomycetota bacterium]